MLGVLRSRGLGFFLAGLAGFTAGPAVRGDGPALFDLVGSEWPAEWITCPGVPPRSPVVLHFRKPITLQGPSAHYVVHVSADNRFVLWVNGRRVGDGPARGSLEHWRYETYDLGPLLHAGKNLIAATVWNFGTFAPKAQMTDRTGFVLQGATAGEAEADTGPSWQVEEEKGQGLFAAFASDLHAFYAAGPGELLDGRAYDWDWQSMATDAASHWQRAEAVGAGEPGRRPHGSPRGVGMGGNSWMLVPDGLPPMEYGDGPLGKIVRSEGVAAAAGGSVTIPAHAHARILLDQGFMTTAYPEIVVDGGRGGNLRLTYAEALVDAAGEKGHRGEVAGRSAVGLHDAFIPDGGSGRVWSTLWWRSWRFLLVEAQTGDQPLVIRSMRAHFSAYPFTEQGGFSAGDPNLAALWRIGVRTARLNAHDAYMDCPYWEQLQYVGDTRIQALVSYVVFGDDRLARQAIGAFDESKTSEGLTQSRYPSAQTQFIPTFSLLWIGMLHDYWLYRPDFALVRQLTPHTRSILDWYASHQRADRLLGPMPWWNFADWGDYFQPHGIPPLDASGGGSSVLSLHFLAALRDAADLEGAAGEADLAGRYRRRADELARAIYRSCWDEGWGLLADNPERQYYSQAANALAVLLDVIPRPRQRAVIRRMLASEPEPGPSRLPPNFTRASLYFRFYLARAVDHAGLADHYLDLLGPWWKMMNLGLTTWAEKEEPTRSDDHGWSAHPNYDLLTLVAGIRPDAPGFSRVRVAPHLGRLTDVSATMPHPAGLIRVAYRLKAEQWLVTVELPAGLSGTLEWRGASLPLRAGENRLTFPREPALSLLP